MKSVHLVGAGLQRLAAFTSGLASGPAPAVRPAGSAEVSSAQGWVPEDRFCEAVGNGLRVPLTLAQVVRPGVRWNTYKKYEQTVRLYLKPGLGRKPLGRVRARRRASTSWAGNDLVFTTRSGQPVEPRNLVRSFERLADRASLRKIRLHDLRHTVATLLKTLRAPQRDAMQILGHARITVTLEIYTDSDSDSQRDALTRMSDRLFGQAGT